MDKYLDLVDRTRNGEKDALEELIISIQDRIYGLALRMLAHPHDAQDAAQEILIKIITNLSSFRGESSFPTWVYRIAANHLLTTRKRRLELMELNFEEISKFLETGLTMAELPRTPTADDQLIVKEIELSCMHGMLICLDREHRLAFILGEVFDVTSEQGAEILAISSAAFRQRLSRARKTMQTFLQDHCGLIAPQNACHCEKQINACLHSGRIKPEKLAFANHAIATQTPLPLKQHRSQSDPSSQVDQSMAQPDAKHSIKELKSINRTLAIFRGHPEYAAPANFINVVRELIDSGRFKILNH